MRKTLMLVIAFTALLAGVVGYIIGSAPKRLIPAEDTNVSTTTSSSANENTTNDSFNKTKSSDLPTIDSLLVTPATVPLPLSLRAGIFFDDQSASLSALEISQLGYPATAQKFLAQDETVLHFVILEPFENEANLQLAKYRLFKEHKIVTQRIITPNTK